jgi:ZIP family zinc transporter
LGLVDGIAGTMTGGLYILFRSRASLPKQSWLLGFSGGIMVAVVLFDLWPEALHFGGVYPTLAGTAIGFVLVQYFDNLLSLLPWYRNRRFSHFAKIGLLLGVGIGAHNFPEGVALGTTFIASGSIQGWLGLALLMAIHNIPEGMVMASAFQIGRVETFKTILALFLVEVPMAFGSTLGAYLGTISPWMVSVSLGFAGGAMFLLVAKELLPMAKKLAGAVWTGTGFAVGSIVGIILVKLFERIAQ